MKATYTFDDAPPLIDWHELLLAREWRPITYTETTLQVEKRRSEMEHDMVYGVTWTIGITDSGDSVRVSISVPTFTDSFYANHRMTELLLDLAQNLPGECSPTEAIDADLSPCTKRNIDNS